MIKSIHKASFILRILSDAYPDGVKLEDISTISKINKSTCVRILDTLIEEQLAERMQFALYRLGAGCFHLTRSGRFDESRLSVFRPVLKWLYKETGHTVLISEIQNGTKLTVDNGELLIAIKDGNVSDLLATGEYTVNDRNISNFASSKLYYISTLESETIKWGTSNPVNFTDSRYGDLSVKAMGTFSYIICDPVKFIMDYLNAGEGISADEYIKNLVINAIQQVVYQNNGTSYTRLPMAVTNTAIKDQLATTGINFTVRVQMVNLTEESQSKIKTAMNNLI